MIVVTVELWPAGGGMIKTLARGVIWNDDTGTSEIGNYKASFSDQPEDNVVDIRFVGDYHTAGKNFSEPCFKRSLWYLVQKALDAVLP